MGGFLAPPKPSAPPPAPAPVAPAQVAKVEPKVQSIEQSSKSGDIEARSDLGTSRRKARSPRKSLISLDSADSTNNSILGS